MLSHLKKHYKGAQFTPNILALFINPFFIIRRGLFRGINKYKAYMSGKMLDFGCGSKPYRHLFQVDEYIGTDIRVSGHNASNKQVDVFYDGNTLPFQDNSFDCVLSSEVFEHIFNLDTVLQELYRILKPDGYMIVTVPFIWDEHEIPYDFGRYTSFGLKHLLEKQGFSVIEMHKSNTYHTTLVQMRIAYIYQHIFPRNKAVRLMLNPIIVFPLTIWGLFWDLILPKNYNFYHNNIFLVQKGAKVDVG